jgi:hypothetical protein
MRRLFLLFGLLGIFTPSTLRGQAHPTAHGKNVTCASCHTAIAGSQTHTFMGQAAALTATNPILKKHAKMTFAKGGYTYTVESHDGQSTYSVTDGVATISVPIQWGFGASSQTWVLQHDGKMYESLVSYYPAIDGLQSTTGAEALKPKTLEEALGREQSPNDMRACFGCHTTNSAPDGHLNLVSFQTGVACEHCHSGAVAHQAESSLGRFTHLPPDLGKLPTEDISTFCGQCHRTWELVVRSRWRGETNVRFQPYRLANSRCFDGADPRISCIACHDPHKDLVTGPNAYDQKCLACHAGAAATPSATVANLVDRHPKTCPVGKSGCVQCHMPKVDLPATDGRLKFTDHDIRIVKPGEAYPN